MKLQWIQVVLAPQAAVKISLGEEKNTFIEDIDLDGKLVTVLSQIRDWDAETKVFTISKTTTKVMNLDNAIAWEYEEIATN
jgi:hypothetical protein